MNRAPTNAVTPATIGETIKPPMMRKKLGGTRPVITPEIIETKINVISKVDHCHSGKTLIL